MITLGAVKSFIGRGFKNCEEEGIVFNYGHTRGYHGPEVLKKSGQKKESKLS